MNLFDWQVPYLRQLSELKYGSETRALAFGFAEKSGLNSKVSAT